MRFNLSQVGFKVTIYILTSPYSPLCSLYVFLVTDKDNLFNNQELLKLVIISSILVALTFVSGVKIAWRNKMLVTLRGQRLKGQKYLTVNRCFFSQHIMFGQNYKNQTQSIPIKMHVSLQKQTRTNKMSLKPGRTRGN